MKVKRLEFNWHQVGSVTDNHGSGEDMCIHEVGVKGVSEIIENEPRNGLQKWNYLVKMEDRTWARVFNPSYVTYFK